MSQTNSVFVGQKSLSTYIFSALSSLEKTGKVTIAARGTLISKAILVAYRVAQTVNVDVNTSASVQRLKSKDEKERDVPIIELELVLKK